MAVATFFSRFVYFVLASAICCSAAIVHANTITGWDFDMGDDGSLQGWTNESSSTTGPMNFAPVPGTPGSGTASWDPIGYNSKDPEYGFKLGAVGTNGFGDRDQAQDAPLVVRSPTFQLYSGQIVAHLLGGTPGADSTQPSNHSDLSGASVSTGAGAGNDTSYIGIALRRDSDGAYLLHGTRTGNGSNGTGWQQVTFSETDLAPIISANPGASFTLDLIDTAHGSFGSVALDTVSVPAPTGDSLVVGGGQWNILERRSSSSIVNLAAADALLALPNGDSGILSQFSGNASVINHHGTGNSGHFGDDAPYLGGGDGAERLVMRITGKIDVAQAGDVTFGFFSNDGGRLMIDGNLVAQDDFGDLATDTLGTINLSTGLHDLEFVFFENNASDTVELFVATSLGAHTSLADASWELLQPSVVPEPSAMFLAAIAALAFAGRRWATI